MDLIFSILASSFIFVLFKSFPRYGIDTLQAVIANYFVAFSCGTLLFAPHFPANDLLFQVLPFTVICGILFISLFILMGLSSQKNGVSSTSVAVKMSMALSVLGVLFVLSERLTLSTLVSLFLALLGVYFVSFQRDKAQKTSGVWMLVVLFFGSAGLDFVLYCSRSLWLPKGFHEGVFASLGFLTAGILGFIYFCYQRLIGKAKFHLKSWGAGIALGIPNYFSIYLLVKAYGSLGLTPQQVLSFANVGVVISSALLGIVVFREGFSWRKIVGLILSVAALMLSLLTF
ncbi:MAG: DMT family transporter [Flavobacteriia bacterium]|nr:DMT family transporter [Flavobacteriia bacterium]